MAARKLPEPSQLPKPPQPPPPAPQRALSRRVIALWLVVVSLVVVFIPLYLFVASLRIETARLSSDLQFVQKSMTTVPTPAPEAQKLIEALAQVEPPAAEIKGASAAMAAGRTDWRAIMAAIGNYDPARLTLTSLAQPISAQIVLNGRAADDVAVTAYAQALDQSKLFSRVILQSIRAVSVSVTIAPTGATVTPTVALTSTIVPPGDVYEIDDFQPKDIIVNQPQRHSFYPVFDADKARFLAKAGRYYRVYTSDLTPGVDTFLNVSVGGWTYTNDDRQAGDLVSEVGFQVTSGSDTQVIVTVTNRGQYGPDKLYTLTVEEVIPTPSATATPSSTPTPSATGTPSPTPTPSATGTSSLTPTPNLHDKYEPDDDRSKPVAVGETQRHNFYPDGDVDKLKFLAKSGRYYRISTAELVLGVDTVLRVNVGGAIYSNDDRQPGDPSSEIQFQIPAGSDVEATVTVTNRGQYGPDMAYSISVVEIIPTPTATMTPTSVPTPTHTPTPTASSVQTSTQSMAPVLTLAWGPDAPVIALAYPAQAVFHPALLLRPGEALFDSQGVEFVIVLELGVKSP